MRPLLPVRSILTALTLTVVLIPGTASADVDLGVLTCKSVPRARVDLVIRSTADIRCALTYPGGQIERYKGETGIALGLDLSFKANEKFAFTVISSSTVRPGTHSLTGKYFGSKVPAMASPALGTAGLVGGYDDRIGLNPVAVGSSSGVGIAAGIGFLYIEPEKP